MLAAALCPSQSSRNLETLFRRSSELSDGELLSAALLVVSRVSFRAGRLTYYHRWGEATWTSPRIVARSVEALDSAEATGSQLDWLCCLQMGYNDSQRWAVVSGIREIRFMQTGDMQL